MTAPTLTQTPKASPADLPWIPTGDGKSFLPLRFGVDSWSELMRLEPGSVVDLHRHTGTVHAVNLTGSRLIDENGEIVGPGDYVYEPPGTVDSWRCHGEEPCTLFIVVTDRVEYLDRDGNVIGFASAETQHQIYEDWCRSHHLPLRLSLPTQPAANLRR